MSGLNFGLDFGGGTSSLLGRLGLLGPTGMGAGNPRVSTVIFDDFRANTGVGETGYTTAVSGGLVQTSTAPAADIPTHPGIVVLSTSTSATGAAGINRGTNSGSSHAIGGGAIACEWLIKIEDLSTAGEEYIYRVGLGDNALGDNTDGIYFEYDRLSSVNWRCCTANSSTRTKNNSTTAVAADAWLHMVVVVNAAGTEAKFYINDVLIDTITTNLPAGTTRQFTENISIVKSAGTTARLVYHDYSYLEQVFTVAR